MIFIELTPFVAFRDRYWTDETFGGLQRFLLASPDAGDLIRGGGGLRKVRYMKARREDLTARQVRALQSLLGDLPHG